MLYVAVSAILSGIIATGTYLGILPPENDDQDDEHDEGPHRR